MNKHVDEARNRWPRAIWIIGNGPYASVSLCSRNITVMLFETLAEAEIAKRQIDRTGCGAGCSSNHKIENLDKRRR